MKKEKDAPTVDIEKELGKLQGALEQAAIFLDGRRAEYVEKNPHWFSIVYWHHLVGAVNGLRHYVEDPKEKSISWTSPGCVLEYDVALDWDTLEPLPLDPEAEEGPMLPFDAEWAKETMISAYRRGFELDALRSLTGYVAHVEGKDSVDALLYPESGALREGLTSEQQEKAVNSYLRKLRKRNKGINPLRLKIDLTHTDEGTGKKREGTATINLEFAPMVIDTVNRRAYFPILIGLSFAGFRPTRWTDADKTLFWDTLQEEIGRLVPEERLPEIKDDQAPIPSEVKPAAVARLVKTSYALEKQKIGGLVPAGKGSPFDVLELDSATKEEVDEWGIKTVGVELSKAQNQVLFAISKILDGTNHEGHGKGQRIPPDSPFAESEYARIIRGEPAYFLENSDLEKRKSARGFKEYSSGERKEFFKALREMSSLRFLFYIKQAYQDGKETRYRVITRLGTLAGILEWHEGLTPGEADRLTSGDNVGADGKLREIALELHPIFVHQIKKSYILKPANFLQEIRAVAPHSSPSVPRFIEYLQVTAEDKRRNRDPAPEIKIDFKILAEKLRMDSWLKRSQWKQIRTGLTECYKIAKELGYLTKYRSGAKGKTKTLEILTLNPERFPGLKSLGDAPADPKSLPKAMPTST